MNEFHHSTNLLRQFAIARSHQDMVQSQNFFSTTSNALVYLNGGAAVALLSFYGLIPSNNINDFRLYFAASQILYIIGSLSAVLSIFSLREGVMLWSLVWEAVAINGISLEEATGDFQYHSPHLTGRKMIRRSSKWIKFGEVILWMSIISFGCATVSVAIGLFTGQNEAA